ncbi:hypothetical protein [Clostridium beijerinckii]|uniref:hypothetical protein n=1 Tax=Clostridium beijerinckii TaxID=1520 RepID=UPI00047ECC78|nr:hypothetical protein [Clostridium beijerinckii]
MTNDFEQTENILYEYKNFESLNKIAIAKIKWLNNDIELYAINYDEETEPIHNILAYEENIKRIIRKIESEIDRRNNQKEKINDILALLDDDERKLITLRYFSKPVQSWASIAQNLNHTSDNCIKKRRKIIKKITELL